MKRPNFSLNTIRACNAACAVTLMLSLLLSACNLLPENSGKIKATQLPFPQNSIEELLGMADNLFDPDGSKHYRSELPAGKRIVTLAPGFWDADISLYVLFADVRFYVQEDQLTVNIPDKGQLVAQIHAPLKPGQAQLLRGLDGIDVEDSKEADQILTSIADQDCRLLFLRDVTLGEAGIDTVSHFSALKLLYLHGVRSDYLSRLGNAKLEWLDLTAVEPTEALVPVVSKSPSILGLVLRDNILAEDIIALVCKRPRIERLDLNHTNCSDRWLEQLLDTHQFSRLELHNTRVTDAGFKNIARQNRLTSLNLSRCAVGDKAMKEIGTIQSVDVLDLAHTDVTDAGIAYLSGLKNITGLNISDTKVSAAAFSDLAKMQSLTNLGLGRKDYPMAALIKLKKDMPKCLITGT